MLINRVNKPITLFFNQKRRYDTTTSLLGCGINAYAIAQTLDPYHNFSRFVVYYVFGTIITFYGLTK